MIDYKSMENTSNKSKTVTMIITSAINLRGELKHNLGIFLSTDTKINTNPTANNKNAQKTYNKNKKK